jgi:ankyrin repeat protein
MHFDLADRHRMSSNIRVKDERNRLPLHVACSKHYWINVTKMLIKMYPIALQENDDQNELPLHIACANLCVPLVIKKLIPGQSW